jgi:hypothetical protein
VSLTHSETIGQIAKALAAAQRDIKVAAKDATNPHFRSRYADLASIDEAARPHLCANGLALTQGIGAANGEAWCHTMLFHSETGEWIACNLALPVAKWDAQGIGSALTYARRYTYSALVAVPAGDSTEDDGEAAVGRGDSRHARGGPSLPPSVVVPPPAAVVPFDPPAPVAYDKDLPKDAPDPYPCAYNAEELRPVWRAREGDVPSSRSRTYYTDAVGKIISIQLPDGPKKPTRVLLWSTTSQGGVYFSSFRSWTQPEGAGATIRLTGVTSTEKDGKRYWNFERAEKATPIDLGDHHDLPF